MGIPAMSERKPNQAHLLLEKHLTELDIQFVKEYHFALPKRHWRFDYLLCDGEENVTSLNVAVEIEGGLFSAGRHTRGKGYQADLDKYNAATMMGYRVLRFSTADVLRGRAKAFLAEHLSP